MPRRGRPASRSATIEHLGDMDELDVEPEAFGAALLMHQARHVGRYYVLGASTVMVFNLVITHFGRDRLLEDRKRAAEATALVGPARHDKLDAAHLAQQIEWFGKVRFLDLRCFGGAELAQRGARVVQPDLVRELCPWKITGLHHVMKEFDQFVDAATKRGDPNLREEGIDVTRNKQPYAHCLPFAQVLRAACRIIAFYRSQAARSLAKSSYNLLQPDLVRELCP